MSQSATFYRISQDDFRQLEQSGNKLQLNIYGLAKSYVTLSTFMGLEFVLSKGQNDTTATLVSEIFNPKQSLLRAYFDSLESEEQRMEFLNNTDSFVPYLNTDTITAIDRLLNQISATDIQNQYNAQELNDNGIYPDVWHNDNDPGQAFNERHIVEDFTALKSFFSRASHEKDYVLVFAG